MKKTITVIITTYNNDKYIKRCIESVINQDYSDLEIVIVDDGSHDNTADICDFFEKKYSNIKVIHQQNQGTISARKRGVENATSEIVGFIDGDDWIDPNYCSSVMEIFNQHQNLDVISTGLMFEYIENPVKNHILFDGVEAGSYDRKEIFELIMPGFIYNYIIDRGNITTSVCSKVIKRKTALDAINELDEKLTFGEDGAYVLSILSKIDKLYIMHKAYYHYEQHEKTQNNNFNSNSYRQLKKLKFNMEYIAKKMKVYEVLEKQIEEYVKSYYIALTRSNFDINIDNRVYLFPDELVRDRSRVIIYGAGKVGTQFVKYLLHNSKYCLAGWIDQKMQEEFQSNVIPCSVNEVSKLQYDIIILAADDAEVRNKMGERLESLGVDKRKVISRKLVSYLI